MNSLPCDVGGVVAQQEGDNGCHLLRRGAAFHDTAVIWRLLQLPLSRRVVFSEIIATFFSLFGLKV